MPVSTETGPEMPGFRPEMALFRDPPPVVNGDAIDPDCPDSTLGSQVRCAILKKIRKI
jgi:hypothetical protein